MIEADDLVLVAAETLTGGCYCGAVRYEVRGRGSEPPRCHGARRRRRPGAPGVAWLSVRPDDFRLTAGEPTAFASTPHGLRRFCRVCGAQLTFQDDRLDEIDVTAATLDHPERAAPSDQTWTASRIGWMASLETLPTFDRSRVEA